LRAPEAYVKWINAHLGFNPRSQANSNALSEFVVRDLKQFCPALRSDLGSSHLRPQTNADVWTKVAGRNVDLVLHEKGGGPRISVRVAVEHKTIMTAHAKARWNRYGDVIAYSNHIHNHRRDCIAATIVLINSSAKYENPDSFAKGLLRPGFDVGKVVADTVKIFSDIPLRSDVDEPSDQPEAVAVVVVEYDGVTRARLLHDAPAPRPRSTVHYDAFLKRICELYRKRFSGR